MTAHDRFVNDVADTYVVVFASTPGDGDMGLQLPPLGEFFSKPMLEQLQPGEAPATRSRRGSSPHELLGSVDLLEVPGRDDGGVRGIAVCYVQTYEGPVTNQTVSAERHRDRLAWARRCLVALDQDPQVQHAVLRMDTAALAAVGTELQFIKLVGATLAETNYTVVMAPVLL